MADVDDRTEPPPPGGFLGDRGPAGPDEHQQRALERIATALEGLRDELAEIKQLLARQTP